MGGLSLETVPHWMRGGTALLRRQRVRRALSLTVHDSFALWIALDQQVCLWHILFHCIILVYCSTAVLELMGISQRVTIPIEHYT